MKKRILLNLSLMLLLCGVFSITAFAADDNLTPEEMNKAVSAEFGKYYSITYDDKNYIMEKLVLPKKGVLTFTTERVSDSYSGMLQVNTDLYDEKGNPIWNNHPWLKDSELVDKCSVCLNAGTYYAKRSRRYSYYGAGEHANYKVDFAAKSNIEIEVNPNGDLKQTATPIVVNKDYIGYIGSGGTNVTKPMDDIDVYKATLTKGKAYNVKTTKLQGTTLLCIATKNEDVDDVFNKYISGKPFIAPYTGTYYFSVWNYSGEQYSYKINVASVNTYKTSIKSLKRSKKAFKVSYKKVDCAGYQVQYSTSKKMTKAKKVTIKGKSATTKTIKKLKSKKTYYVRVRTYKVAANGNIYSSWSSIKKVKTK